MADSSPSQRPSRIPPQLERFVVEQDYAQYTEIDQAVWRFVLLQTYSRLAPTAHAAYRDGLGATGISVERIPHIAEMDACLARFGWGAVCVDGFIPPRAFQEFQAAGILPIAADMRTRQHLVYTPAPDIIHEAAGHAPILPDQSYAAYLRRVGELGKKAFTLPEDAASYQAIFDLSELKEAPGATPTELAAAEARVHAASALATLPSEAARVARLYWWTAEYGLVGSPGDYKLYGAGLLSSLWESYTCHDPSVRKLPLDAGCCDVSYDITKPQPQLFVTPSFEHLFDVVADVERSLSYRQGPAPALAAALASGELATFTLAGGSFVSGVPRALLGQPDAGLLELTGPVALGHGARLLARTGLREPYYLPLGRLRDGRTFAELGRALPAAQARVSWELASGLRLEGRMLPPLCSESGIAAVLRLADYRLSGPALLGFVKEGALLELAAGSVLVSAEPGTPDPAFFERVAAPRRQVPRPRELGENERALLELYEQALAAHRSQLGSKVVTAFERIHRELTRSHPEEWLLRWNLLESLLKLGENGGLAGALERELGALEQRFAEREPIASGLRYLAERAA